MAKAGHNSGDAYSVTADELRQFVERIENVEQEVKAAREDLKEVYAEAKGRGYDTKVLRKIIAAKKRKPDDRAEERAIGEMYCEALGLSDIFG